MKMKSPIPTPVLIALIMSIVAVSALGYMVVNKYNESKQRQEIKNQETQAQLGAQKIALDEAQKKIELLNAEIASSTKKAEVSTKTPAPKVVNNSRIIAQLKEFDDYLEYDLVGAGVDCSVLMAYYPLKAMETEEEFAASFPKPRSSYEDSCRQSYVAVLAGERNLIAEPELKTLRELLSTYTSTVKAMSSYALGGGQNDTYSAKLKIQRTEAREEVIRLKRKYGVPVE